MIIDNHTHFDLLESHDQFLSDMDGAGVGPFCILVIDRSHIAPDSYKFAHALWMKHRHPNRCYVFGALDFAGMFDDHRPEPNIPFVKQVQTMMEMGCDGLKLLLGKPDRRKWTGQPLDGAVYTPVLNLLEETGFPILWHVGDPPEFWDRNKIPQWAKIHDWWYDATHPTKAQIDKEIANVIQRHPRLNVTFAHFFFMSDHLKEAEELLKKHPNIRFDLAPGIEMNHNFTANWEASREFFLRHADRILYGTDSGMMDQGTSPDRPKMVRRFIDTRDEIVVPTDPCFTPDDRPNLRGLGLPESATRKIFHENFRAFVGRDNPKPLNPSLLKKFLKELSTQAKATGEKTPTADRVLAEL
jgi:predicted TIM-barrel fold metal-dependent hydrolase